MLPKNIPEERVPGILARAAELDRQTISVDALRAAALEAGISPIAVEQALAEYEAGGVPASVTTDVVAAKPRTKWRQWLGGIAEPLKLGALALVVGLVGSRDVALATVAICWLIGTSGFLAWRDRGQGNAGRFQISTIAMSALMFLGMVGAHADEDAIGFVATFGLALLVLGTLVVHFGGEREKREEVTAR